MDWGSQTFSRIGVFLLGCGAGTHHGRAAPCPLAPFGDRWCKPLGESNDAAAPAIGVAPRDDGLVMAPPRGDALPLPTAPLPGKSNAPTPKPPLPLLLGESNAPAPLRAAGLSSAAPAPWLGEKWCLLLGERPAFGERPKPPFGDSRASALPGSALQLGDRSSFSLASGFEWPKSS